jgi:pimeloyl-ACP methyl ester carboxylesterase
MRSPIRGFGRSSVPAPGYPWSLEGFATDLIHLMDHLGIDKAHLIGETIGGDYYDVVKRYGVEAWVRQTANRRLEPGAVCRHLARLRQIARLI